MTSAATTQSLNLIPQWLRSSSNSAESTTNSATNLKVPTNRVRYSKDEILALRKNLSAPLLKNIRQEIVKNLKAVENVYRPQILSASVLNGLAEDESAEIQTLSNFVCGRTPNGASRPMSNSNTGSNPSEPRKNRETVPFPSRNRVPEDRENQSTTNRRVHGNTRNSSDDWRRQKTDDDEHRDSKEDSSTQRSARNGLTKRPERSMEQRTKSDDKWNTNDHRTPSANQSDNNQNRAGPGWKKLGNPIDRNAHARRQVPVLVQKEEMPEWMDETVDTDGHAGMATFEQDGTYIRSPTVQPIAEENQKQNDFQSTSDQSSVQTDATTSENKEHMDSDKSPPQPADTPTVNIPNSSKEPTTQTSPTVQKIESVWEEDYDHHDLAKNIVELTLAEDNEESSPSTMLFNSLSIANKPSPPAAINALLKPVNPDDKIWFYKDPQNTVQGPFSSSDMERWYGAGYFTLNLPVKRLGDAEFSTIQKLSEQLGRLPFRTDTAAHQLRQQQQQQQQNAILSALQKKSNSTFTSSGATSNNAFVSQYLAQQQSARQHVQNSLPFNNRSTSMTLPINDLKRTSSQSQMQLHSPQSASSLINSNSLNDPAIIYSQQRSLPTNSQPISNSSSYDENLRAVRQFSSQTNDSILARLNQAAQIRTKQQQDKFEEQRRRELQQQSELDFHRHRIFPQMESDRYKRQENDFRFKQEQPNNRLMMPDTMKKSYSTDIDQHLYFQSQMQAQNDQSQIDAIKAENVRRYQQHYQELSQNPNAFQMSDGNHWSRHSSFPNDQSQFMDMQDSEQERRIREAASALLAHQNPKNRSLGNTQTNSWNASSSSYQEAHRQQPMQNDGRSQMSSMWEDHSQRNFQQSTSSNFWDQQYSSSTKKQGTGNSSNSSYVPILR